MLGLLVLYVWGVILEVCLKADSTLICQKRVIHHWGICLCLCCFVSLSLKCAVKTCTYLKYFLQLNLGTFVIYLSGLNRLSCRECERVEDQGAQSWLNAGKDVFHPGESKPVPILFQRWWQGSFTQLSSGLGSTAGWLITCLWTSRIINVLLLHCLIFQDYITLRTGDIYVH